MNNPRPLSRKSSTAAGSFTREDVCLAAVSTYCCANKERASGRSATSFMLRLRRDFHVLEFAGFIERTEAHFTGSQAEVDGAKCGQLAPIHGDLDRSRGGMMDQLHVVPVPGGGECRRTLLGADAHAFTAVDVKNTVMHRLLAP